jgi:hypothetical protein
MPRNVGSDLSATELYMLETFKEVEAQQIANLRKN